ncbi:lipase ROG1 family protein [Lachancea thermotolerans CBS 6340]|uniref:KLTH0C03102p n=1 Tax=Lachancea thermotolerans (strain ATCC 56472 / CBS 6340 / NRRL Y-8284) TaxID=559295 RepID=C5DDR1_LACTC|nr:KLTH0C03102p [Lachancea thermotolerans CBS 6340]CAR21922.1 KLTH0C03102p [Lachancea thermotolerans CBS 6340]
MLEPAVDKTGSTAYHLVVLVHGLWGNRSHLEYISNALKTEFDSRNRSNSGEQLFVYTAHLNEGYKTYDGIDVCGVRVASEIEEQISALGSVTKFSICGYSLGGLISRYALGVLYKRQVFKKRDIKLVNFTTFCTPHVGVYAPGKNAAVKLFNAVVPLVLGNSGKQMFLKDKSKLAGGLPLVLAMSMENSVFYKALQEFESKSLYANVINDKRTAWWTSGISRNDPFFDIDENNGHHRFCYVSGYGPIVVDHTKPVKISRIEDFNERAEEKARPRQSGENMKVDKQEYFFLNYWIAKLGRWLMVLINLLLIAPLWALWFVISGTTETIKSTIRVTKFVKGYSHQFIQEIYDIPSSPDHEDDMIETLPDTPGEYELQFQQSLQDQTDTFIESVLSAIERKNTLSAVVDEAEPCDEKNMSDEGDTGKDFSMRTTLKELELYSVEAIKARHSRSASNEKLPSLENLHLELGPAQLQIIDSLNKIPWSKFPVYIRNTPSTHACAIVRHGDPKFGEGKVIVKHWVSEVFSF